VPTLTAAVQALPNANARLFVSNYLQFIRRNSCEEDVSISARDARLEFELGLLAYVAGAFEVAAVPWLSPAQRLLNRR
jgi:hypothetical protein